MKVTRDETLAWATHQWKVIWVNPQDAQVRVVSVVPGNLLQDLQELIAIWIGFKKVESPSTYAAPHVECKSMVFPPGFLGHLVHTLNYRGSL